MRGFVPTMISKTSIVLLAISLSVVVADRRRVPFMNCLSAKSNSSLMATTLVRSRIDCSVTCLNDQGCLSASYCKTSDGYTCQLSGIYANGGCSGLGLDEACTLTAIEYPCENGGTFIQENRTCHCVEGFIGAYCQRRYRDCVETPGGNALYVIHPFGSDHTFQWKCNQGTYSITEFIFTATHNYTHTWQMMKPGLLIGTGQYFFIGLDRLHQLTSQGTYDMFVSLINLGQDLGLLWYRNIRVDSEAEGYALHWDHFEKEVRPPFTSTAYQDGFGGAGDATKNLNGARFGTYDNDVSGCAKLKNIGWWYNPVGCMAMDAVSNGMFWPMNRSGIIQNEYVQIVKLGLEVVHFKEEDDLVF